MTQPWATLIVAGLKDVENRSWVTRYRGPLVIHAGSPADTRERARVAMARFGGLSYPRGCIIGVVNVVDVVEGHASEWAVPDMFHWVLENARAFASPVSVSGSLGLWDVPGELLEDACRPSVEVLDSLLFDL